MGGEGAMWTIGFAQHFPGDQMLPVLVSAETDAGASLRFVHLLFYMNGFVLHRTLERASVPET